MYEVLVDEYPQFVAAFKQGGLSYEGEHDTPNTELTQTCADLIVPSFEGESLDQATQRLKKRLCELVPYYEHDLSNPLEALKGDNKALNCLGRTLIAHAFYSENPDLYPTIGWTNIRGNHHFFNSVLEISTGKLLLIDTSIGAPIDAQADRGTFFGAVEAFSDTKEMTISNKNIFGPLFERTMSATRELFIDQLDTKMIQEFSLISVTEIQDGEEVTTKATIPSDGTVDTRGAELVASVSLVVLGDEDSCNLVDTICGAKQTEKVAA